MIRLPMLPREALDAGLAEMAERWQADGGDVNFIRTFGRLPETLKRFVAFYSPLVRRGLVEHRTKELVRLRLAQLNRCHY
ncbi:MAG: carboxymuconolactone decarboxylase family protein [Candidatus Rokubacteria bacterium]|nr:carboxymuconolactone decarboxylase family protein [Candidatus Rokubacteria bacterium]